MRSRFRILLVVSAVLAMPFPGAPRASADPGPCAAIPLIDDHCERWVGTTEGGALVRTVASPDGSTVFATGAVLDSNDSEDVLTAAYRAATGELLWRATYGGANAQQAQAIAVSPDGRHVYVAGWTQVNNGSFFGGYHGVVVSYDAGSGTERWATVYTSPDQRDENPWGIAVGPSVDATGHTVDPETVYVSGVEQLPSQTEGDPRDANFVAVAFDGATGAVRWRSLYDGPAHEWDYGYEIARSPDGRFVYLSGTSETSVPDPNDYTGDMTVVAFDAASGERRWVSRYVGPEHRAGMALGIAVSPDANVVAVTGMTQQGQGAGLTTVNPHPFRTTVYVTAAFDARTGEPLWSTQHVGSRGPDQIPDYYNDPGLNTTVFVNGMGDQSNGLAFAPDGSTLYVAGTVRNFPNGTDYGTIAYDPATGRERWTAIYDGPSHRFDYAQALAVSPDGSRIYVTGESAWWGLFQFDFAGESFGYAADDVATVAYDAAGKQVWVARYDGPGRHSDAGIDLAATSSGVFVAGLVADGSDPVVTRHDDAAVLAYDV
ncbi:MAG: PQQ-binding-like beta-propeller repeat protein [Actinomycetota bacterium]